MLILKYVYKKPKSINDLLIRAAVQILILKGRWSLTAQVLMRINNQQGRLPI